jgi:hypothetical protein
VTFPPAALIRAAAARSTVIAKEPLVPVSSAAQVPGEVASSADNCSGAVDRVSV